MRYYKLILLLFTFLILPGIINAKRSIYFTFSKHKIAHSAGHCKLLKVVDLRIDIDVIGNVGTGALSRETEIRTEWPFNNMLSAYYDSMGKNNPSGDELLLLLYYWELEDNAYAGEIGTLYFDGDFYKGGENGYKYVGTIDSVFETEAGNKDVSKSLLVFASKQTESVFNHYGVAETIDTTVYSMNAALQRRSKRKSLYPIYTTTSFKKGIYYTEDQFLNNTPVDTPFIRELFVPQGDKKQLPAYYLNKKGKRGEHIHASTYFAIYDGQSWSVSVDGYNLPMSYEHGEFTTEKSLPGLVNYSTKSASMTALGGGGLVAGLVAGAAAKNLKWHCYYKAKFDPQTKTFVKMKRLK